MRAFANFRSCHPIRDEGFQLDAEISHVEYLLSDNSRLLVDCLPAVPPEAIYRHRAEVLANYALHNEDAA